MGTKPTSPRPSGATTFTGRRQALRLLASLPVAAALGACAAVIPGQGPAPRLYHLNPQRTFADDLPEADWQLAVETPFAPASLNTTRIAIAPTPTRFDYYARAGWTDRAPLMIQNLMIESFENATRRIGVGRETGGVRVDYVLRTELRDFQTEITPETEGRVNVGITARLVRMPQRNVIASESFRHAMAARADSMDETVAAFDAALGEVLRDLVRWTLTTAADAS